MESSACFGLTTLTGIIIPDTVTIIERSSFMECGNLISVDIPNSVTLIKGTSFGGCRNLQSIIIPDSVITIEANSFDNCINLVSINIPKSVTNFGGGVFSRCKNLSSINVNPGNTIYDSRNNCNAIIETITNTLIQGCPNTVIPNSVTSIGGSAFISYSSLISITIPNSVVTIGVGAFSQCGNLSSINIPNSVTSISNYVFQSCRNATVTMEGTTPPTLGSDTSLCDVQKIIIPHGTLSTYQTAWSAYTQTLTKLEEAAA